MNYNYIHHSNGAKLRHLYQRGAAKFHMYPQFSMSALFQVSIPGWELCLIWCLPGCRWSEFDSISDSSNKILMVLLSYPLNSTMIFLRKQLTLGRIILKLWGQSSGGRVHFYSSRFIMMHCFSSYGVKYRMSTGFYCIDGIRNYKPLFGGMKFTVDHFLLQGAPDRVVRYHQPYLISSLMIC